MEYADVGIRVNAICPGLIVTDLNRNSSHLGPMIGLTPLARAGEADEVAQLVLFLASDASGFITGEDFVIDGGFTAACVVGRAVSNRCGGVEHVGRAVASSSPPHLFSPKHRQKSPGINVGVDTGT